MSASVSSTLPLPRTGGLACSRTLLGELYLGLSCYVVSSAVIFSCVALAVWFPIVDRAAPSTFLGTLMYTWDAGWYSGIACHGYAYNPGAQSSVAFFPLYPWLGSLLGQLTGAMPAKVLLVISNACFAGSFVLLIKYVQDRFCDLPRNYTSLVLLSFASFPFNLYYAMNFSEPLFLLVAIAAVYGMSRGLNLLSIALMVGFATGIRITGFALCLPLLLCIWKRSPRLSSFAVRSALLMPVACWGLIVFLVFQHVKFGNALAFYEVHEGWLPNGHPPLSDKLAALATLKPIWSILFAGSWRDHCPYPGFNPLFSGVLANTVFFSLAAVLVVVGAWKRWLNGYELLLAAALLLIPYLTKSVEENMFSMGRYATVAFPIYLVLGRLLASAPRLVAASVLAVFVVFLGLYTFLFSNSFAFY
jgi:hypothetical protein